MGIRDRINSLPPIQAALLATVVVAIAAFIAYRALSGSPDPEANREILLKCSRVECGAVARKTLAETRAGQRIIDGYPSSPGVLCPSCGQNTLEYAWQCPNDQAIFGASASAASQRHDRPDDDVSATPKCPTPGCNWDPIEANRKALAERMRQK